jgi:hypothetical protein
MRQHGSGHREAVAVPARRRMAGSTRHKGEEGEQGLTDTAQDDEGSFRPGRSSVMVTQSVAHL